MAPGRKPIGGFDAVRLASPQILLAFRTANAFISSLSATAVSDMPHERHRHGAPWAPAASAAAAPAALAILNASGMLSTVGGQLVRDAS